MLTSSISNTEWCHSVGESCNFMDSLCFILVLGRCYCQWFLGNLMLLADVIGMLPLCLQLVLFVLADLIAMLLCYLWQMVMSLPSG